MQFSNAKNSVQYHHSAFSAQVPPYGIMTPPPPTHCNWSPVPFSVIHTSLNPQPRFYFFCTLTHTGWKLHDSDLLSGVTLLNSELDKCQLYYLQLMALSSCNYHHTTWLMRAYLAVAGDIKVILNLLNIRKHWKRWWVDTAPSPKWVFSADTINCGNNLNNQNSHIQHSTSLTGQLVP